MSFEAVPPTFQKFLDSPNLDKPFSCCPLCIDWLFPNFFNFGEKVLMFYPGCFKIEMLFLLCYVQYTTAEGCGLTSVLGFSLNSLEGR
jgi:hypothetical protein